MRRLGPLRVGKFKPLSRHKTRYGQHVAEMSISVPLVEGVVLALDRIGEHHECVFRHLFPPSRVLSQRDELTPLAPCGILLPGSPRDVLAIVDSLPLRSDGSTSMRQGSCARSQ